MKIILTKGQQVAFDGILEFLRGDTSASMAVLEGYAGTGKTTLVGMALAQLHGYSVAVAAPTNKAVRVLRDKLAQAGAPLDDEPAQSGDRRRAAPGAIAFGSIHAFLGLQMTEREDGSQECKSARDPSLHEYDVAIIDECSMLGDDLFRHVAAAKRNCRVLFVGDPAQLPPIQPIEAVSPTFSRVMLKWTLTEVVRQAADNPIIALSIAIRAHIEADRRIDAASISEVLPPPPAMAGVVFGDSNSIANFALWELKEGRDARILAFTNQTVQAYNARIHEALHGVTVRPFVPGERVVIHQQCDALQCDAKGRPNGLKITLITSEEAQVLDIIDQAHPRWDAIPACKLILERDGGDTAAVYMADNPADVDRAVSEHFATWRQLKAQAEEAAQSGRHSASRDLHDQAKSSSGKAWALRKAFAPLRHVYAITAHKSQGSTFDTAIVDLADLSKMRSAFQFNRALYVAATRPSKHLAIIAP